MEWTSTKAPLVFHEYSTVFYYIDTCLLTIETTIIMVLLFGSTGGAPSSVHQSQEPASSGRVPLKQACVLAMQEAYGSPRL